MNIHKYFVRAEHPQPELRFRGMVEVREEQAGPTGPVLFRAMAPGAGVGAPVRSFQTHDAAIRDLFPGIDDPKKLIILPVHEATGGAWSGNYPVPRIGAVILATGLGLATVLDYKVVDGYLGLTVRLHNQPEQHIRRNGRGASALVFGAETRQVFGYVCLYNGKRHELYAESHYTAGQAAEAHFKPPKSKRHMVSVMLAEKDGQTVVHAPS